MESARIEYEDQLREKFTEPLVGLRRMLVKPKNNLRRKWPKSVVEAAMERELTLQEQPCKTTTTAFESESI